MSALAIAGRALARRHDLVGRLADADLALDAALAAAAREHGAAEVARRLGMSEKTVYKRIARHRERTA